jgi:hypothetical protein
MIRFEMLGKNAYLLKKPILPITMRAFEHFCAELQTLAPFRIRYKDQSWEMQLLGLLVLPFCPDFLTRYTTVLGQTVYFPSRAFVEADPERALRIMAHEAVHLLDFKRFGPVPFALAYLFPQVLTLGVFAFPWLGLWSLSFLFFLLPLPAPFRFWAESRAYALELLTYPRANRARRLREVSQHFFSWSYYKMYPFSPQVSEAIEGWVQQAEQGEDRDLLKLLLIYEWAREVR